MAGEISTQNSKHSAPTTTKATTGRKARVIAFYLPQFHPIPENDTWWEPGFTEWTNVTKCTSHFGGHHQPNLPTELGFYDLRVPEARAAQADLARQYGIEGFCYWHYWFGEGKRLLERPFNEVLQTGEPDFPFCLGWANETWAGMSHGLKTRILITQQYPGFEDFEAHFKAIEKALSDKRYICVDGKPVFLIYKPHLLPNPIEFTNFWRKLALNSSIPGKGFHFVGVADQDWIPSKHGFDASVLNEPGPTFVRMPLTPIQKFCKFVLKRDPNFFMRNAFQRPRVIHYKQVVDLETPTFDFENYPCVVPNWDTTPRMGKHATVFQDSTPELFRTQLKKALNIVSSKDFDHKVIFLKSWNEWAEGNYVEPDRRFGRDYLKVISDEILE